MMHTRTPPTAMPEDTDSSIGVADQRDKAVDSPGRSEAEALHRRCHCAYHFPRRHTT
jgi:hypothetical protein